MARLNVNPTRMELSRLKERLKLASRGHKLLKDKQDELMRQFISLIRENNELRNEVEEKIESGMHSFSIANALLHDNYIAEVMTTPSQSVSLNINQENIMNIRVPQMNFNYEDTPDDISDITYGYLNSNSDLDSAIDQMLDVMMENVYGNLQTVKAFEPLLKCGMKRIAGIVDIESSNNYAVQADDMAYHASAAAFNMMGKGLCNHLRPDGFTFRWYCEDEKQVGICAAEYIAAALCYDEKEPYTHSDENRLVLRNALLREIPW